MHVQRARLPNTRTLTIIAAITTLLLAVVTTVSASAADPSLSGFSIDGTVPDDGADQYADASGNTKELGPLNSNTTKLGVIHDDVVPTLGTSNPNGQVDLRNVWFDTNADATGTDWLYFAWERDSSNGSGVIAIEFQQAGAPEGCDYSRSNQYLIDNCNPWENRQTGDFILIWDQVGNTITISVRYFDATTNSFGAPQVLDASEAAAALSGDNFRGEAVVDLSVILGEIPTSCVSIGNVIPGTVTGNADTADYKDTVFADIADSLEISNCGRVDITKADDAGAAMAGVNFALYTDDGDADFDDEVPATGFAGEALACTTDAGGDCSIVQVPYGNYWINETNLDPAQYGADDDLPEKVTVSDAGGVVTLDYVNPRLRGSIQVEKLLAGTSTRLDGATFVLDADGDPATPGDQTTIPAASDDEGGTVDGLFCIDDLLFGDYHVLEALPPSGHTGDDTVELVTVSTRSTCADRGVDDTDETFENKKITSLVTFENESGVVVGNDISDTATLSDGASPTGNITFELYDDATCSGDPIDTQVVEVDQGNHDYGPVTHTATAPGTYSWIATYSGDDSNTGAAGECGDDGEVDEVVKATPAIATDADQDVVVGSDIHDTATVTGGYEPSGDVTFVLYAGDDCDAEDEIHAETLDLVDGVAGPATHTPSAPGTYSWIATYNGDANNVAVSGACGDDGEVDVVNPASPGLSTTPDLLPNDRATLSGGFGELSGELTFALHDTPDCSGEALYTETVYVEGAGGYGTANTSVFITADGTYSWEVGYSGDGNNDGATSTCEAERYIVDITPDP